MATRPAFGWHFRYVWGLRGLVSALAESHMSPWMVWFPNHWFHPDYPPAWPDLLSAGTGPAVSVVAVLGHRGNCRLPHDAAGRGVAALRLA